MTRTDADLPRDVVTLIHRSLPSIVHIELLLLLLRTAPRGWSAAESAFELRSNPQLVEAVIADLVKVRLAERVDGSAVRLCIENDATMAAMMGLQEAYDRKPVTLVRILYQRPASSIQAFADAFKLR